MTVGTHPRTTILVAFMTYLYNILFLFFKQERSKVLQRKGMCIQF